MKTLALVSLLPFVGWVVAACGTSEGSEVPGGGTLPAASAETTGAAGTGEPTAVSAHGLPAACTAYFDALAARKGRCGTGPDMLNVDAFESARGSALAHCLQQGGTPGTGYTPAFYATCSTALAGSACDDDDAIVTACWEPRGSRVRGTGCATDDQCADGYCKLDEGAKKGSTCGKCDVPVWGKEHDECVDHSIPTKNMKCRPGLTCLSSMSYGVAYCNSARERTGRGAGESCGGSSVWCEEGLTCIADKCTPLAFARAGEDCLGKQCEVGSTCIAYTPVNRVCVKMTSLGEPCDRPNYGDGTRATCNHWLECSPTHRCVLPEILECN